MTRELSSRFNREVEQYRRALLYYAKQCDWDTFKEKAGRLFDYVESIEMKELERRFYRIFSGILAVLIVIVMAIMSVDFGAHQELARMKTAILLGTMALSTFELYFYVDYRKYTEAKAVYYKNRRDRFIRLIEQDFRSFTMAPAQQAA